MRQEDSMITSKKWKQVHERMKTLGISENDLTEKFIIGFGRGGQKRQKTASCVYLQHVPTGIDVKCQQDRLRENNRYYARRRLCKKIEAVFLKEKSEQQKEIEKIRRQKRRRSRRAKQKILEEKHHRAEIKEKRKSPSYDKDE